MSETVTKVGAGGRVVLPAAARRAMGVGVGDEIVIVLDDDGVRILTREQAVRRAQRIVRGHVGRGRRLSRELVADRREEARRG